MLSYPGKAQRPFAKEIPFEHIYSIQTSQ